MARRHASTLRADMHQHGAPTHVSTLRADMHGHGAPTRIYTARRHASATRRCAVIGRRRNHVIFLTPRADFEKKMLLQRTILLERNNTEGSIEAKQSVNTRYAAVCHSTYTTMECCLRVWGDATSLASGAAVTAGSLPRRPSRPCLQHLADHGSRRLFETVEIRRRPLQRQGTNGTLGTH